MSPTTALGVDRSVSVPSPSCPLSFAPQHHTVPSVLSTHEKSIPSETCLMHALAGGATQDDDEPPAPSP